MKNLPTNEKYFYETKRNESGTVPNSFKRLIIIS